MEWEQFKTCDKEEMQVVNLIDRPKAAVKLSEQNR